MAHELGNYVGTRLGYGLRLASKHVLHRSSLGSRAGRLSVSGCPGSHDNDKREDSSGGGLWWGFRRVAGAGRNARAATEESYGSSPGSSSVVSCLRSLRVP